MSLSLLSWVLYRVWYTQNQIVSCLRWGAAFPRTRQHDHSCFPLLTMMIRLFVWLGWICASYLFTDLSLASIMFLCCSMKSLSDLEWPGWLMVPFFFFFLLLWLLFVDCLLQPGATISLGVCDKCVRFVNAAHTSTLDVCTLGCFTHSLCVMCLSFAKGVVFQLWPSMPWCSASTLLQ